MPLAGWPSPLANKQSPQQRDDFTPNLANVAQLTGWATPRSTEAGHSTGNPERALDNKSRLEDQVFLSGWATPTVRDHKDGAASLETNRINARLGMEVRLTGETSNGSPAPTEKPGQLNPDFTRWLMGYPAEWADCAPTAMP